MTQRKGQTLSEIYNTVPTIPYEGDDETIHTEANDFRCDNPECPCQNDYEEYWQPFRDRTADQERNETSQTASGEWW